MPNRTIACQCGRVPSIRAPARYVPAIVYQRIQEQAERPELIKVLYWIALHPFDDDGQAVGDVAALGLPPASALNPEDVRARAAVYGVKLLGRMLGRI